MEGRKGDGETCGDISEHYTREIVKCGNVLKPRDDGYGR